MHFLTVHMPPGLIAHTVSCLISFHRKDSFTFVFYLKTIFFAMVPTLKLRFFAINDNDICLPNDSDYFFSYIASMGFFLLERDDTFGERTYVKIHLPLCKDDIRLTSFNDDCKLHLFNVLAIEYGDSEIKNIAPLVNTTSNVSIVFDNINVEEYHLLSMALDNQIDGTSSLVVTSPTRQDNNSMENKNKVKKKRTNRILKDELIEHLKDNDFEKIIDQTREIIKDQEEITNCTRDELYNYYASDLTITEYILRKL